MLKNYTRDSVTYSFIERPSAQGGFREYGFFKSDTLTID